MRASRRGAPRIRAALVAGALLGLLAAAQACSETRVAEIDVASIRVEPEEATLLLGDSVRLRAVVTAGDGEVLPGSIVTWSSGSPGRVAVRSDGTATALGPGEAVVQAAAAGVSGTATIRVAPAATIDAEPRSVGLFALLGSSSAQPVHILVRNAGGGELGDLAVSVLYASGEPVGWLTPSLPSTRAPTELVVTVAPGALEAGTYHATLVLSSPDAAGPFEIPVELTIVADRSLLAVSPAAVGFAAQSGGQPLPAQTVRVTAEGEGALTGLGVETAYAGGGTGWLSATLASTTAPTDLRLVADPGGLSEGTHRATVRVSAPGAANSPVTVAVTFAVGARPRADLSVAKSGPSAATSGDAVSFSITVSNGGPATADGVSLLDSLPAGLAFVSASDGGVATSPGVVLWPIGSLAPGATVSRTVQVAVDEVGTWTNVARAASSTVDTDTADHRATSTVEVVEQLADLSVGVVGPSSASIGDTVVHVLTVRNAGPSPAAAVVLVDSIPDGMALVRASSGASTAGRAVTWPLGEVAAGASVVDTVRLRVVRSGAHLNVATVSSATADPDVEDRRATALTAVGAVADVSVEKVGPSSATQGDEVTYTLTVRNGGPDAAAAATLVDSLAPGSDFVSASGGGGVSGRAVTWALGTVPAGGVLTRTVRVALPDTGVHVNVARVSSSTADPDAEDRRASTSTRAEPFRADLGLTKTGPAEGEIGETLSYTIDVRNDGPHRALEVVVTDSLPEGMTYVSSSSGGSHADGVVTWEIETMETDDERSMTVTVSAVEAGAQTDAARVRSATVDPDATDRRATVTTTIASPPPPEADLSITKTGPATAETGQQVTYTLEARNEGPSEAASVQVVDTLPAGMTYVASTDGGSHADGVVTWSLGTMVAGAEASVTVTASADEAGEPTNVARVSSATADADPSDDRATLTTSVTTPPPPPPEADVSIIKTGPATAETGEQVVYTVTARNDGPDEAASVQVVDSLPGGMTYVASSGGGSYAGGVVTWDFGTIAAGEEQSMTVTATADDAGGQTNVARVSSATTDPDPSDTRASATTTVTVPAVADLRVEKSGPARTRVGDTVWYEMTVVNDDGPAPAASVVVIDSLPAGVTFESTNHGGTESGGVVTWELGTLAEHDEVTLMVRVDIVTPGTKVNVVRVRSGTTDPDPGNDRATATMEVDEEVVESADLSVTKTGPASAEVGETLTFAIDVDNEGEDEAGSVLVQDSLPAGMAFVSATDDGSHAGGVVTWTLDGLEEGEDERVEVTVRVDQPGALVNVARVSAPAEADGLDNRATTTTVATEPPPLPPEADLSLAKSGPSSVEAGQELTYTLSVGNDGPSEAASVQVVDSLPSGMTYVSSSGGGTHADGVVTWAVGTLAVGAEASMTVTARADEAGSPTNVARVTSATADPDPLDNRATTTTSVEAPEAADLSVLMLGPSSQGLGSTVIYLLTVRNSGPDDARDVMLLDSLPAGIEYVGSTGGGSHADGVVTWSSSSLDEGFMIVTVFARASGVGTHTNVARLVSSTADPDADDRRATVTTSVSASSVVAPVGPLASRPLFGGGHGTGG